MGKKFRCGLLVVTENGDTRVIDLRNGGGSRDCYWDVTNMSFSQLHHRLLDLYQLRGYRRQTSLYDYQYRLLNFKRFTSFEAYIRQNGFHSNSIIVYLGAREVDNIIQTAIPVEDKTNSSPIKSSYKRQRCSHSKTNPIRTPIRSKYFIQNNLSANQQEQILPSCLDYSFTRTNDKIINDIQYLIKQNGFDEILMKIFQYICTIHGYISSTIQPLIQQIQQTNEFHQSQIKLYTNNLNSVYEICQLTEKLFDQNQNKFSHTQIFSTIKNSFSYFNQNLKNLRNKWLEHVESIHNRLNVSSTSSSTSIQSKYELIELEDDNENSIELLQVLPSSSSSIVQTPLNKTTNEQNSIFQPILNSLNDFYNTLHPECLSLLEPLIKSTIDKIKLIQTSINLYNELSICDGKRVLLSIRDQFVEKLKESSLNQEKHYIHRQLDASCKYILNGIKFLFGTLDNYQFKALTNNK